MFENVKIWRKNSNSLFFNFLKIWRENSNWKIKIFNSKQKWFTYFQTLEILAPKNSKLKKVDFWRENSNCRDLSIHCAVFFSCNRKQWVFGFDQPLNNGCGWNHLQFFYVYDWLILDKIIKDWLVVYAHLVLVPSVEISSDSGQDGDKFT